MGIPMGIHLEGVFKVIEVGTIGITLSVLPQSSRLNDKWIKPYSDKVVERKASEGKKNMLVFSPAFVADCLETIYEIGTEYNEIFEKHGGKKVQLVESLNDHPVWIQALKSLVLENNVN